MPGVFGVDATSFARIADVVPIPNALLLQARAMCTMPALPSLQAKDKAHAAPMNNNVSAAWIIRATSFSVWLRCTRREQSGYSGLSYLGPWIRRDNPIFAHRNNLHGQLRRQIRRSKGK